MVAYPFMGLALSISALGISSQNAGFIILAEPATVW